VSETPERSLVDYRQEQEESARRLAHAWMADLISKMTVEEWKP